MKRYFDIFRKVIDMAPGHKLSLISLFVSDFLNSIATLLPPVATAGIIAVISNGSEFKDIWLYVILYIVFCIIQYAALAWNYHVFTDLSIYYYNTTQLRIFEHVTNNDSILEKISKGKITDTYSEDISYLVNVVDETSSTITGLVQLIVIFFIFASHNILVALFAAVIDFIYIFVMNRNSRYVAKYYEGTRKYNDKMVDVLNQILGSLRQVKSLNIMDGLTKKTAKTRSGHDEAYRNKYRYLTDRNCKIPMIVEIGKIALYVFLAKLVIDNKMSIDQLVLLISYFEMMTTNTSTILGYLLNLNNYNVRINRVRTILNYTASSEIDFGDIENDYIDGVVRFDHVNYFDRGRQILNNVSFTARPNEVTAIVGRPGAGKTTIVNLIYRLYRIKSGAITIDDESIYNYSKAIYSSNVSGVFQRSFAFRMSIRDNLALVDARLEKQIEALNRVGLYKDIQRLPYGINTVINEEKPVLTDGQLQKLAIARAILSRAEILLFDEVTSNVDPETSHDIINIIQDLKDDHTIILVTHKPEMMKIADTVVVLKDGKVMSKGKNEDVYAKSALYRDLRTATFSQPSVNDDFLNTGNNGDDGGYINDPTEEVSKDSQSSKD